MSNFGFSSSGFIILGTPGVVVKKKKKKKKIDNGIERILLQFFAPEKPNV